MNTSSLNYLMNLHGSDKGTEIGAKHNYTQIYEKYFEPFRDESIVFVEFGVDKMQSAKAWREYFSSAKIYMVDLNDFSINDHSNLKFLKCNQSKAQELEKIASDIGEIDFLIDDGGHCMDHQQLTFGKFFPFIKPGGCLFIEDLITSLPEWESIGGNTCYGQPLRLNPDRSNSTVNIFKKFQESGKFESEFLTDEENSLLSNMIDEVIFYPGQGIDGRLLMIRKKK